MEARYQDDFVTIHHADCLDVMRDMEAESVSAIVTDPPYGLGFMGRDWDHGVPGEVFWREALRVAKPGAHLVAFGGTRTYHRLAVAIEDAGWEIRDGLGWLYGSGFPKSLNLDGKHKGWGTALKPAWEPIILARKPLGGTVAACVQEHGCGAINVDGCRVGTEVETWPATRSYHASRGPKPRGAHGSGDGDTQSTGDAPLGRWPANIVHDGSDEVLAVFPDSESGSRAAGVRTGLGYHGADGDGGPAIEASSGSAARFFADLGYDDTEVFLCRANAIMDTWKHEHVSSADSTSRLDARLAASAVSDAVTLALLGGRPSSVWMEPSTTVTPSELRRICASAITATLMLGSERSPEASLVVPIQNGCLVRFAEASEQTGITTITTSLQRSDGSAASATLQLTSSSTGAGAKDSNARFRYCAKATTAERDAGLHGFEAKAPGAGSRNVTGNPMVDRIHGLNPRRNIHPTVKPVALMRWLVRLVTPPEGVVLDPFMGSGTTLIAARAEGFLSIGVDLEAEHVEIAWGRMSQGVLL